jgi:protein-disulfide isomerase
MRLRLFISAMLIMATAAWGQGTSKVPAKGGSTAKKTATKTTQSASPNASMPGNEKANALKPPTGAKVAIVVFEDLQCPDCARAFPLVRDVSKAEKVPVVHHDFPLPIHTWSFQAAIIGRYFDTKSKEVGDQWREFCFANQTTLSPDNLNQSAQKFATDHKTTMPFLVDPNGKLADKVKADFQLGQRIGIQHTPTLFVVTNGGKGEPFVEVVDRTQLTQMIESAKASAK